MNPSQDCYDLIKHFEGCRLEAYPDPGTGGVPWTIGYGSTEGVRPGMVITQDEANLRLQNDVRGFADKVNGMVVTELQQCQFDALVSFAFNLGAGNLRNSTLLKLVNADKFKEAAEEFPRWVRAAGKILPGLVKRREAERKLFKGEAWIG